MNNIDIKNGLELSFEPGLEPSLEPDLDEDFLLAQKLQEEENALMGKIGHFQLNPKDNVLNHVLLQINEEFANVKNTFRSYQSVINNDFGFIFEAVVKSFYEIYGLTPEKVGIRLAFHGTTAQNAISIVKNGFYSPSNPKYKKKNGLANGEGIYVTPKLDIAKGYGKTILACAVVLGEISDVRPQKEIRDDSYVTGDIWVIKNSEQLLPIYMCEL